MSRFITPAQGFQYCDCGEPDEETTDYPRALENDGSKATVECSNCEKEFTVTLTISYEFSSAKPTV